MYISGISNKSVSIIIPARNEERNLGRLPASLASQTCQPKKIIVMDDRLPVSCYGGKDAVLFRMYPDGLRAMIDGFSKGFAEGASAISFSMLALLVAWITGGVSVTRHLIQSVFGLGEMSIILWICLYVGFSSQIYWMLRRIGNFGILTCIFYPLSLIFFVLVFFRSLLFRMGIGDVFWKGRRVKGTFK